MMRFLLSGALLAAAAWSVGAVIAAAMVGEVSALVGFASLAITNVAFFAVVRLMVKP